MLCGSRLQPRHQDTKKDRALAPGDRSSDFALFPAIFRKMASLRLPGVALCPTLKLPYYSARELLQFRENRMHRMEKLRPLALLLLRVGIGVIFMYNGYPKFWGRR